MNALAMHAIPLILLAGCDKSTNPTMDPNVKLSLSSCHTAAGKMVADTAKAKIIFLAKDSLELMIESLSVQCGSEYAFAYTSVVGDTELRLKMDRIQDSGEKCLYAKDAYISIKSKGEDFSGLKTVLLNGTAYVLIK